MLGFKDVDQSVVVDLRPLSTAKERCQCLRTGAVDALAVQRAVQRRYDQLPVLDDRGSLLGVMPTERARTLFEAGLALDPTDDAIDLRELERLVSLPDLLEAMAQHRAIVFRDNEEQAPGDPNWFALVTISDLNRHHFRSYLYPMFARLEANLAALIDQVHTDPWEWLTWTGQASAELIGRWELDKRKGVDTTPLIGCTLTHLVSIACKSDCIARELQYHAKTLRDIGGSLVEIRNRIMHPVKPLVTSPEEAERLGHRVHQLQRLTDRVIAANEARRKLGARSTWFHHDQVLF